MKNLLLTLTLLILSASPSFGQVTAKIVADQQVDAGDLVVLDGSRSSNAAHYVWKLINSDKKFLVFEGGEKVVTAFGTEGDYRFLLIVVGQDNNGKISVDDTEWTIRVGNNPTPKPVPTPTPTPNPDPVKPDLPNDQFDNLGQAIVGWSRQYLKEDGKTVAGKIGDNYKQVAKELENGETLLQDTFTKVSTLNKGVYPNQSVHDQFILVGSRVNEIYTKFSDSFDRDTMVTFLNVVGDAFKALR